MDEATKLRLESLERVARQSQIDSRTLIKIQSEVHSLKEDQKETQITVNEIRKNQGRNFLVSLIAATGSIGTIFGIIIALTDGGPG